MVQRRPRRVVAAHAMDTGAGRRRGGAEIEAGDTEMIRVERKAGSQRHLPGNVGAGGDVTPDVVLVVPRKLGRAAHGSGENPLTRPGREALDLVKDDRGGVAGI